MDSNGLQIFAYFALQLVYLLFELHSNCLNYRLIVLEYLLTFLDCLLIALRLFFLLPFAGRYNAVFHLVTAADGAEQFYTLEVSSKYSTGLPVDPICSRT